jgi:MFS family permease
MYRRVGFLLFTAGWGANHFASLLVVYRKELGLQPAQLGLLFGAYALGLVPGLVLSGRASDSRGRRALVLPASLLTLAASLVLALGSHEFPVLLAGRLLFGLGMGSIMSPGSVWIQELSPADLGPRRATLVLSAGFGLGPLFTALVAELGPWPMVLPYVLHVLVLVVALLLVRAVPETAALATSGASVAESRPLPDRKAFATLARLLPVAPWAFGLAALPVAILPGLMRPHVSRPVLYAGFVIVTALLSGVLVQPLTTRIGRLGDLMGLGIGAVGIMVAARAIQLTSPGLVLVASVMLGVGYGLVMTSGLREIADHVPRETRGMVVGMYYVLTYVGFSLPFVHAIVAKTRGDVGTFHLTAMVAVGSLVVSGLIHARRRASATRHK